MGENSMALSGSGVTCSRQSVAPYSTAISRAKCTTTSEDSSKSTAHRILLKSFILLWLSLVAKLTQEPNHRRCDVMALSWPQRPFCYGRWRRWTQGSGADGNTLSV